MAGDECPSAELASATNLITGNPQTRGMSPPEADQAAVPFASSAHFLSTSSSRKMACTHSSPSLWAPAPFSTATISSFTPSTRGACRDDIVQQIGHQESGALNVTASDRHACLEHWQQFAYSHSQTVGTASQACDLAHPGGEPTPEGHVRPDDDARREQGAALQLELGVQIWAHHALDLLWELNEQGVCLSGGALSAPPGPVTEGLWRVQGYHHPGRIDGPQKPQTLSAQLLGLPACWCVDLQQPPTLPRQFTFQLTNFV
ncbi:MAG: hypothetical protein FRX49_12998 [Trebouxia sp. A1-2]|nr:MAG: hypothetical protein FRX49_12998 [Trebouxia sp. A1-2]